MIDLFLWYMIFGLILFALAIYAVIRRLDLRLILATGTFLLGLVLCYFGLVGLTGVPQPVWLMLIRPDIEEAVILGASVQEDVGIFILLDAPGLGPVPKYFWFPYSVKMAEQLEKAQRAAKRRGQEGQSEEILMGRPFEASLEDRFDKLFYPPPQPKLPDKPEPGERFVVPKSDP